MKCSKCHSTVTTRIKEIAPVGFPFNAGKWRTEMIANCLDYRNCGFEEIIYRGKAA